MQPIASTTPGRRTRRRRELSTAQAAASAPASSSATTTTMRLRGGYVAPCCLTESRIRLNGDGDIANKDHPLLGRGGSLSMSTTPWSPSLPSPATLKTERCHTTMSPNFYPARFINTTCYGTASRTASPGDLAGTPCSRWDPVGRRSPAASNPPARAWPVSPRGEVCRKFGGASAGRRWGTAGTGR